MNDQEQIAQLREQLRERDARIRFLHSEFMLAACFARQAMKRDHDDTMRGLWRNSHLWDHISQQDPTKHPGENWSFTPPNWPY